MLQYAVSEVYMEINRELFDDISAYFSDELSSFIIKHPRLTFYALALDCNAETKGIYLGLNTLEAFDETLNAYQSGPYSEYYENPHNVTRLKYNPGDWKYKNFANVEFYYTDVLKERYNSVFEADGVLLNVYAQALLNFLYETPSFKQLNKTDDFISFIINHDDDELEAIGASLHIN